MLKPAHISKLRAWCCWVIHFSVKGSTAEPFITTSKLCNTTRSFQNKARHHLGVHCHQTGRLLQMLQEALSHYQAALRLNPQNEAAKRGLERLEKQMKSLSETDA
ncbi:hypothetical protein L6164_025482 [Bauhinia variegata]|uniref:Uncharacterized protein n=1 Tax=Bauhinia variegata TaxID=167791 RepID=A0ACB9M3D8_BAUVA|nr:hypothetical protein L6164_025482 [Bauhinia variegata]